MERKKEVKEARVDSLRKGKKRLLISQESLTKHINKTLNKNKNYYKNNFLTKTLKGVSF